MAVRIALRCKEEIAKILVLLLVVFIFVYLGFEHSIANMGTFSMAILGGGALTLSDALHNLLYSTAGNVVGGVFTCLDCSFTYLSQSMRAGRADAGRCSSCASTSKLRRLLGPCSGPPNRTSFQGDQLGISY